MEWFLGWIGLSVVVGVCAQTHRNRNGAGWFFLSLLISLLIAGLLVLALPKLTASGLVKRSDLVARIAKLDPRNIDYSRWDTNSMVARLAELEARQNVHPGWKNLKA